MTITRYTYNRGKKEETKTYKKHSKFVFLLN